MQPDRQPAFDIEREEARMRLARNQVLGMRDYVHDHADYKHGACARLERICDISRDAAPRILHRMLHVLTAGRLTVNFTGRAFFQQENHYEAYFNCFERAVENRQNPKYQQERNNVEKRLVDYPGKSASYLTRTAVGHTPLKRYGDAERVRREIAYYGIDSPIWYMMRPRYAALDFGHCINGGASLGGYGKCFFILRDHMKAAATYTASDSYYLEDDLRKRRSAYGGAILTPHQVSARFHELEKLLYYCHPGLLREICDYAVGKKKRGTEKIIGWHQPGHKTINYIEAQLHTDFMFNRDVDSIVLSNSEIMSAGTPYSRYHIDKHARIFARKHGLHLYYVD
jgi:hypothetical protein